MDWASFVGVKRLAEFVTRRKMSTYFYSGCVSLVFMTLFSLWSITSAEHSKPNIVIFMVDDLGVADLACFGNDSIKTPNIDKLASEGARLTHNLAGESICTPSRAAFLTGRYAVRSGMTADPGESRVLLYTSAPGGLPTNETTFARILRNTGYSTGLIGKWHLGLNKRITNDFHYHPLKHGFEFFYGTPLSNLNICTTVHFEFDIYFWVRVLYPTCFAVLLTAITSHLMGIRKTLLMLSLCTILLGSIAMQFYSGISMKIFPFLWRKCDCFLMRDFQVVEQPFILENVTAKFTDEAIHFINRTTAATKPFLLLMSYMKVHTALFTTKAFQGHSGHSKYGDNVEEMDWSVGQIMDAIDKLGIRENTFVYFTSDHGPHLEEIIDGEYHGGWKGIFKGGKAQSWEGGIRVPGIASWPTHIPAGIDVKEPTSHLNVFPTVLKLAGAALPSDRIIDGKDMMPLLKQQVKYSPNEFMFHYCAKAIHAVRYRPRYGATTWKAHFVIPKWTQGTQACFNSISICGCYGNEVMVHNPPLLFNITADPSENFPVNPENHDYKLVMKNIMLALHEHKKTVTVVPNQLKDNFWYPWRQACCNFPYCSCKKE